jgi:hypothetical protein
VFQAKISVILAYAKECIGRVYTGEHIYICLDSRAALQALEASTVMVKLVWKCRQALCAVSSGNEVMLLSTNCKK